MINLNLDKNILEEIINISKKYDYINKVVLFGSRAREDNILKSDIDLAIYSDKDLGEYIEDIELNTRTLLEFDFSDMKNIKDEFFKEQINKDGVTIYEKHRF
ncbi:nucleotidyltransferase domain-containing protein [Clostridium aquiflavi]|uniref:Nucleotidyltransferase domain-containing protein n=1 Tax=Clostridium aquiflavi TaxID=3073603 RepID=A0ABU1EFX7_9CLOT|nr:nucleotidyltransferase domain-containing protein [Clostridium sp. 5N-1]MDR5587174.1 nucleotidyltransferase domain-containing protein [Clostridium sp. 5N-1]